MKYFALLGILFISALYSNAQNTNEIHRLPHISLWMDASNPGHADEAGKIGYWNNIISPADSAFQDLEGKRPAVANCADLNNMPVVRFDGVDDQLTNPLQHTFGAMFVVARWNGEEQAFPSYNGIISKFSSAEFTYILIGSAGSSNIFGSGTPWKNIYVNSNKSYNLDPINRFKIIYADTDEPKNGDFIVGASLNNARYWNGDIAEIIGFDAMPSDSVKDIVYNYLRYKYAPPVALKDTAVSYGFKPVLVDVAKPWFVSYDWSNGSQNSAILAYPDTTYTVSVSDIFGFSSTDSLRVSLPLPRQLTDTTICLGDTITWNPDLSGPYTYKWSDGSAGNELRIATEGKYWVAITDTAGYEWLSDTVSVGIDLFANSNSLGDDRSICKGESISLIKDDDSIANWVWNTGDNSRFIKIDESGSYSVIAFNNRGCALRDTVSLSISGIAPEVSFVADDSVCLGDSVSFVPYVYSDGGSNIENTLWSFGDGHASDYLKTKHLFAEPGEFIVSLSASSANGCSGLFVDTVVVLPSPVCDFDIDFGLQHCTGSQISLADISSSTEDITSYLWNFSNGLSLSGECISATFDNDGIYDVSHSVTASNGCSASLSKSLLISSLFSSPGIPVIKSPASNAVMGNGSDIRIDWTISENARFYVLDFASDSLFNNIIVSKDTILNNFFSFAPDFSGTVFCRVGAANACGIIAYSNIVKFSIADISSLPHISLWMDASNPGPVDDDGLIAYWNNIVSPNDSAFQPVENKRPAVVNCPDLNNMPVVRFDGVDDQLTNPLQHSFGAMFVVARWNGEELAFPTYNGIISKFSSAEFTYILIGSAGSSNIFGSGTPWKNIYVNSNKSYNLDPINRFKIIYADTDEPKNGDFIVGASLNNARYWNGDIAEIIGFDAMPSDSVKDIVYNYLRYKYAPPVSLKDTAVSYGFKPVLVDVAKPWFVSYDWTNGSHGSAILAYPDTTYTVSVSDIFGFSSTDSLRVSLPLPRQLPDTTICLGDTITWNPELSGPYTYKWSDGSAGNELRIATEGKYWVAITDTAGYEWLSDTVYVAVDRFPQQMTLGADTINTCVGDNIYLQNGFSEATKYQWSDGTTADHLVAKEAGSYTVTASNLRGCIGRDTAYISIMGMAPTVDFDNSSLCATRQIAFTDKSSSNDASKITSYHWDFGDGDISAEMNPTHKYDTSGNFQISYTISCENGCSNILKKNIYVNALPKADFKTSQTCSNTPVMFTSTSTTANGYLTSWQWTINDSIYDMQNLQTTFTQHGQQAIEMIVTANNGCTDTLHRNIEILQGPEVDFTYSAPCLNTPIYLTNKSKTILGLSSSYTWKSDTAIFSTQKSPSIIYKDTSAHQITLTIKQIANGCISSLTKDIRMMPNPAPTIMAGTICEGQDAILEGHNLEHASISKKWLWTIDSLQFTGEHRTSRTFGAKGKHKISLQITDSAGCVATFDTTVSVHETPTATFRPLSTRGPVPFQTEFTNTSANADSLLWIFGDGEESTDIDVCHTYHTDGIYNVQLIASNSFCSDTAQQVIEAIYPQIDIVLVSASAKTDNGQIAVSAVVANRSNYDIPNVSILWYDNVGHRISETIADTIKQGKIVQYEFVAKIGEARPDRIQYICVSAEPSTAYTDDTPSDNEYCIIFNKDEFSVCQPMPNPAKDKLAISYILPNDGNVRIELYNHNGGKIGNLYDSQASAGYNVHNFDVSTLNPGIYFYRITSGNESKTQMLIIER